MDERQLRVVVEQQRALRSMVEQKLRLVRDLERGLVKVIDEIDELSRTLKGEDQRRDDVTTRERIRGVLAAAGSPVPMAEVVRLVHEEGSAARADTIRAVLMDMSQAGQVRKVRRGMYQAVIDPEQLMA
jgi:hypothetical protein